MRSKSNEYVKWLFLAPISNVVFGNKELSEFRIDRIILFNSKKLPRIRKRIGFPCRLSEYESKHPNTYNNFFRKYDTFASMRLTGQNETTKDKFLSVVREELSLLSLSQLGFSRRRYNASPVIASEISRGRTLFFMMDTKTRHWIQGNYASGKWNTISIEKFWFNHQKEGFFLDLLKVIRGEIKVSKSWRTDIKNAAILAGQSQMCNDLPQAFLWNMIAIELLLTHGGDKYKEMLPERAEAFLGWTIQWYLDSYKEKIDYLYQKRCNFVHKGRRNEITINDLLFSDTLLLNVITNIVKHHKLFNSKEKLIEFSEKIQAENILGIKSKNRPKTFRCSIPVYTSDDHKKI
jgi:hypothetical protein